MSFRIVWKWSVDPFDGSGISVGLVLTARSIPQLCRSLILGRLRRRGQRRPQVPEQAGKRFEEWDRPPLMVFCTGHRVARDGDRRGVEVDVTPFQPGGVILAAANVRQALAEVGRVLGVGFAVV